MPAIALTPELAAEYAALFARATPRPDRIAAIDGIVDAIFAPPALGRYRAVARATRVPPAVIGIIHSLEASLRFTGHLHNGDPLTARTRQVPSGRPLDGDPPFGWEQSAADALRMKALDRVGEWSIPRIAYELERYNGWGYRRYHPAVPSPYLWSFTSLYTAGKYVADGRFSKTAVSRQAGGMALLARMLERRLVVVPAYIASSSSRR